VYKGDLYLHIWAVYKILRNKSRTCAVMDAYMSIRCFNSYDIRSCSMFTYFTNMLERKGIKYCKYQSPKHAMPL
jgi:hypothetical protein